MSKSPRQQAAPPFCTRKEYTKGRQSASSLRLGGIDTAGGCPAVAQRPFRSKRGVGGICQPGFTLIELIIVIIIVAVLAGALLNRVWFYQEQAEKTAMVEVANTIQTALVLQVGRLMARGTEAETAALATDNPMNWLAKQPPNYSGEFYDPTPRSVAPGNWMFDLKTRELIYVVDRAEYFVAGKGGEQWIRYRVNLMREASRETSGRNPGYLDGALFEPVEPYRWLDRNP